MIPLDVQEVLSELEYNTGSFPREAVAEAVRQKERIIPELLRILENAERNIEDIIEEPDYFAHIYAMFLLAQFREKRAYPLVVSLFSHPGDTSDAIAGDFVCEDLPRVLASICDGDTTLIKQLIENREADEYVRSSALKALLILALYDEEAREETEEYYRNLLRGKLEREYSFVWSALADYSSCLCSIEIYEEVRKAYEEGLVDPWFVSLEDLKEEFSKGWKENSIRLKEDRHYQFVDDTIDCMEWWACFKHEERAIPGMRGKKVGRNDPCPCGSGKKYKKCCWRKDRLATEYG